MRRRGTTRGRKGSGARASKPTSSWESLRSRRLNAARHHVENDPGTAQLLTAAPGSFQDRYGVDARLLSPVQSEVGDKACSCGGTCPKCRAKAEERAHEAQYSPVASVVLDAVDAVRGSAHDEDIDASPAERMAAAKAAMDAMEVRQKASVVQDILRSAGEGSRLDAFQRQKEATGTCPACEQAQARERSGHNDLSNPNRRQHEDDGTHSDSDCPWWVTAGMCATTLACMFVAEIPPPCWGALATCAACGFAEAL